MQPDDTRPEAAQPARADPTLLRLVWAEAERVPERQLSDPGSERFLSTLFWSTGPDEGPTAA
jgi:hypothetical protein